MRKIDDDDIYRCRKRMMFDLLKRLFGIGTVGKIGYA